MEVFADVIDAMEASEAEEALGEVVDRTISSCAEESGERAWYVRLWGRIAAADISSDEHRSAVRYGGFVYGWRYRVIIQVVPNLPLT